MKDLEARRLLAILLLAVALLAPAIHAQELAAADPPADPTDDRVLLVHGATVLTMDDERSVLDGGAVAIRGSEIVAVGPSAEILARFPEAETLDATGQIVLPGLVNAHTHVPMTLFRGLADDLTLMEWLEDHIFPAEKALVGEEFVRDGTRLACLEMLRGGITAFADMYYYEDELAEEVERCGMRAVLGQTLIDFPAPDFATWDDAVAGAERFVERWKGHPRIVPAVAPHAAYTVSGEHLVEAHALAEKHDVPLLLHLAEDLSEVETIRTKHGRGPVEYVAGLGLLDERLLAAHVIWPTPGEIELLAAAGVGVAHCPESNLKLAAGIAPVPRLLDHRLAVGLGTDGTASNNDLDLWSEMDVAAKIHKNAAMDPTVLPAPDVVHMATRGGAEALKIGDLVGSLEQGKRADLIVVRTDAPHQTPWYDPYSLLVYSTRPDDVDTVIVDGRVVVRGGEVLTVDAAAVLAKAESWRQKVLATQTQ